MRYFNDLRIGTRLTLTLAVFVSLVVIVGVLSLFHASSIQENLDDIVQTRMVITEEMNELRLEVNEQARIVRNLVLVSQAEQSKAEREALAASRKVVADVAARVDARITSPKGRELQTRIVDQRAKFREGVNKFLLMLDAGQREQAVAYLMDELRPVQLAYMEALNQQIALQKEVSQAEEEEAAGAVGIAPGSRRCDRHLLVDRDRSGPVDCPFDHASHLTGGHVGAGCCGRRPDTDDRSDVQG